MVGLLVDCFNVVVFESFPIFLQRGGLADCGDIKVTKQVNTGIAEIFVSATGRADAVQSNLFFCPLIVCDVSRMRTL